MMSVTICSLLLAPKSFGWDWFGNQDSAAEPSGTNEVLAIARCEWRETDQMTMIGAIAHPPDRESSVAWHCERVTIT